MAEATEEKEPIRLVGSQRLRGCNLYHRASVLRLEVDMGHLTGARTGRAGPGFADRFAERFSSLKTLVPGCDIDAHFLARLSSGEGASIEETLLEAVLAVETATLARMHHLDRVAFAAIVRGETPRQVFLIWETQGAAISRRVAEVAFTGLMELFPEAMRPPLDGSFEDALEALNRRAVRRRLPVSTSILKLAAQRRGLPVEAVTRQHLRIGHGVRQHNSYGSMTGFTSISATKLALDKSGANQRLKQLGLPVPDQLQVATAGEARAAFEALGRRVTVKPIKGNRGRGVTSDVVAAEELDDAFKRASDAGSGVLVERFIPGKDYRLLVIGGRFAAALTRVPPSVTGDGSRSIRALIAALNDEPDRDGFRLRVVEIDADLRRQLELQGCVLDDIPEAGREIALRAKANVSTGGLPIDVTDRVHPDNRRMAEKAAMGIGLDVVGVDFITTDVARSYKETGGGIIEVNARPGISMHSWPREGTPRDVAGAILELAFPPGDTGSVPTLLIAGDRGTGRIARAADRLLRASERTVALSLKDAAYLGGRAVDIEAGGAASAAKTLLHDPSVECLVAAVSLRRAARYGLHLNACDAAAIMARSHSGNVDLFYQGVRVLKRANRGRFVVAGGNAMARTALRDLDPARVILVASRPDEADVQAHLAAGHGAVLPTWRDGGGRLTLFDGGHEVVSVPLANSADAARAPRPKDAEARSFAIALAFAAGLDRPAIEAAVQAMDRPAGRPDAASETERPPRLGRAQHAS